MTSKIPSALLKRGCTKAEAFRSEVWRATMATSTSGGGALNSMDNAAKIAAIENLATKMKAALGQAQQQTKPIYLDVQATTQMV
jgi:hypothetical protein